MPHPSFPPHLPTAILRQQTTMICLRSVNTLPALLFALLIASIAAINGPDPTDVPPSSYETPDLRLVFAPVQPPSCKRTGAPTLTDVFDYTSEFSSTDIAIQASVDWCSSFESSVRFRVLEYSGTPNNPVTHVLNAYTNNFASTFFASVPERCEPYKVYVEACVRHAKNARAACSTSQLITINAVAVPEPRLAFRPPIELRLAPGDSANIVTKLVNATERGPLGNGGQDIGNRAFAIGTKITSQYGRVLKDTGLKQQTTSTVSISERDSSYPTRRFYNGASAYLVYANPTCVSNTASFKNRYSTRITVRKSVKSLVKQDTSLPTFSQPVFPPIKSGQSATIKVIGRNTGGGIRMGGMPTELHYQWYIRTVDYSAFRTYAEPIEGATSATLKLNSVVCESPNYSRYQVSGLKQYYVDVCNTYGCRRSEQIVPRYINDDGSIITDDSC